jgi:hypothetical protein
MVEEDVSERRIYRQYQTINGSVTFIRREDLFQNISHELPFHRL